MKPRRPMGLGTEIPSDLLMTQRGEVKCSPWMSKVSPGFYALTSLLYPEKSCSAFVLRAM